MYRLRAEKGRGERKQWSPIVVPEMENGNWRKRNETKQKKKRKKKEKKKEKDTARDCSCVLRNRGTLFRK